MLDNEFPEVEAHIIDCRYPYEYIAGHIKVNSTCIAAGCTIQLFEEILMVSVLTGQSIKYKKSGVSFQSLPVTGFCTFIGQFKGKPNL